MLLRLAYYLRTDFHEKLKAVFFRLRERAACRPCRKDCEPRTDALILFGLVALIVLMFVKIMFMYRNNEESKSFEVFFFFFGGVGKRHPLFLSFFCYPKPPKTIKNPENCEGKKRSGII